MHRAQPHLHSKFLSTEREESLDEKKEPEAYHEESDLHSPSIHVSSEPSINKPHRKHAPQAFVPHSLEPRHSTDGRRAYMHALESRVQTKGPQILQEGEWGRQRERQREREMRMLLHTRDVYGSTGTTRKSVRSIARSCDGGRCTTGLLAESGSTSGEAPSAPPAAS